MKKIITTALIAISMISYAQEKQGHIAVAIGGARPVGNFASKNINNDDAGYATNGISYEVSVAYKIKESNFGVTGMFHYQFNHSDLTSLDISNQGGLGITQSVSATSTWAISGLMAGGFGEFPITEKVVFTSRAMFGFLKATSPDIKISGRTPAIPPYYTSQEFRYFQPAQISSSLSYLLGIGLKVNIGKRFNLLLNYDYIGLKPTFDTSKLTDDKKNDDKGSFKQSMSSLNLTAGFAFRF